MSAIINTAQNFLVEVAKGNVPGHEIRTVVSRNPDVGVTNEHIWGGATDMIYPTVAETWEIVSDNVNDTALGSGSRVVRINSLDGSFNPQTQDVVLNGTTPVALTGTHFRPDGALVISSGSSESNEGTIEIRATGSGNPRQYISPGFSNSQDSQVTVPADKTGITLQSVFSFPKNDDGYLRGRIRLPGTNTFNTTGEFPFYQNITAFDITGQFAIPAGSDVLFEGRATNPNTEVNCVLVFLLVDNDVL